MFSLNSIDKLGNTQAASSSICSTQGSNNRKIVQQLVVDSSLSILASDVSANFMISCFLNLPNSFYQTYDLLLVQLLQIAFSPYF